MPYMKPNVVIELQEQLVELMEEFSTIEEMYKKGELNKTTLQFLQTNPVTGDYDTDCKFMKVNGVYVDLESTMEAERQELPIKRIQNGE